MIENGRAISCIWDCIRTLEKHLVVKARMKSTSERESERERERVENPL